MGFRWSSDELKMELRWTNSFSAKVKTNPIREKISVLQRTAAAA